MPTLTIPDDAKQEDGLSQKVVAEYRGFIDKIYKLSAKQKAELKYTPKEDFDEGRKVLLKVAAEYKKYVKVRKARGQARTLQVQQCSKAEFDKFYKPLKSAAKKTTTKRRGRKPGRKPAATATTPQAAESPAAEAAAAPEAVPAQEPTSPQEDTASQETVPSQEAAQPQEAALSQE